MKRNTILRTIVPVHIDAELSLVGGSDTNGMGDILRSYFFSPEIPTALGWTYGALVNLLRSVSGDVPFSEMNRNVHLSRDDESVVRCALLTPCDEYTS